MKFLLDVCAESVPMREALANLGHDVLSAREPCPQASDEALLALAREEQRVVNSEDKDLGNLPSYEGFRTPASCALAE